jgi:signal transduction histidine kinase
VLPPGLDVTAYRIVEEALTDVLRGGGAGAAHVLVRYGARDLELEVLDESGGPREAPGASDGTFGLRERVAIFGGELHAGRRRGGVWALQARLPIERAPA